VTSTVPAAASASTSATTSPKGRLISTPRTDGTMQKAQALSQPIWIVTQAECARSRRTGRAEGNASDSARISISGPSSAAWCRSSTARPTLWVPKTTSTKGARAWMAAWSFWARQPATAICMSGRARFSAFSSPRWP
jgi:hypothetical protein